MVMRLLQLMLLLSCLFSAATTWAAEVRGRSSTQVLWFNDFYNGRQVELAEYLQLSLTKLDDEGKFSIYGYGRGTQDVNNGEGLNGRLYYLYGEYRDLFEKLDVRVGRQFVNLSAGTAIVDGARVDIHNAGPVGFTFMGGRDVVFGTRGEIGHEGDYAVGVAAFLSGFRNTDADISWFRKWDGGDVSRDLLGASFKQYLSDRFKLYGNARYDITAEVFNEVLGGMKYFPTANLVFTGEYYQSYPTFDTTDIFSVFAVNRYYEYVTRADYTVNEIVAVHGGYNRQGYGDGGHADVFEAGCTLRPVPAVSVGLEYQRHSGYGGKLDGGIFDVTWDTTKDLQVAAGLAVDGYSREFFPGTTGNRVGQTYWAGSKYRLAKNMTASLRLEENVSARFDSDLQGRFVFNYDF